MQFFAGLQMTANDLVRPRASISQAVQPLSAKPPKLLEDGLHIDLEVNRNGLCSLALHDPVDDEKATVRTSLCIRVELHDQILCAVVGSLSRLT